MPKWIKTKDKKDALCPAQVLRVLAGKPNDLEIALGNKQTNPARTYTEAAKILGCTTYRLKKVMNGVLEMQSGIPVNNLQSNVALGRPKKDTQVSIECMIDITSRATLRRQCGMTMSERATETNLKFGSNLACWDLRKIYKRQRITCQKIVAQVAPIKFRSNEIQLEQLEIVKQEHRQALLDGFEILQYDQCLFSANRYDIRHWSNAGHPLSTHNKWVGSPVVVVCGFISIESGKYFFPCEQRNAFNGSHMAAFVRRIRRDFGPDKKICLFGDNARINKSILVRESASRIDPTMAECRLLYNQPYRPDMNGVEHCWAVCKRKYRAKIANLRVGQIPFSNLAVVRQCIEELDHDLCSRIAINGWARLMAAEPVQPEAPRLPDEPAQIPIEELDQDASVDRSRVEGMSVSSDEMLSEDRLWLNLQRHFIREMVEEEGLHDVSE